jgi:hypothetical protein
MSTATENRKFQRAFSGAPEKDMQQIIAVGDLVKIYGEGGVWTVIGARVRNLEPKFQLQRAMDESTIRWFQSDVVTLMQKSAKPDLYRASTPTSGFHEFEEGQTLF